MSFSEIIIFITTRFFNVYVLIGMSVSLLCCLLRRKLYKLSMLQTLILYFVHAIFGNFGDRFTSRIVFGFWGGGCWYGVPLAILLSIWLVSKILKKDFGTVGDMSAAGICCLHILSKIACIFQGCCTGIVMFFDSNGIAVHFPCREFEIVANTAIFVVLLVFERKHIASGMLWELYMIWYSVIRYIAAWLRDFPGDWEPFFLWIPAARLWTVVIWISGFAILFYHFTKKFGRKPTVKELLFAAVGKFPVEGGEDIE